MPSLLIAIGTTLIALPVLGGVAYLLYRLFSMPLRQQERTRFLLDLMETGIAQGASPERTIQGVARCGDPSLGWLFRKSARMLEQGQPLGQVVERVPQLFPPQIAALLKAGQELGDLRKVLPVCRNRLTDAVSKIWTAHHYLVLLAFVVTPAWTFVFTILGVFVFPKFQMIAMDMGVDSQGLLQVLCDYRGPLVAFQACLLAIFYCAAFIYASEHLTRWLKRRLPPVGDWLATRVPWRRMRLQRDFSALLGMLLDAGVPEARAVSLAAEGTGNSIFRKRAAAVVADLGCGVALPEAVRRLDAAGEFRWRLTNAARAGQGFLDALSGWHEALEAKSFQQEETAAQLLTTGLVFVNGLFVALLTVAVFQLLARILEEGVLW